MAWQYRITEAMIKREVMCLAYHARLSNPELNFNDPELKCVLRYEIDIDEEHLYIQYKDKTEKYILQRNDLSMSLDDFAERILMKMIIELRDSFNQYDDAGQIK